MPASPKRSLQRDRSKWGFSLAALSCLGMGVVVFLALMLAYMPFLPALAIGLGVGVSLGLTVGRDTKKVFKALYKPNRRIRGYLPNERDNY